MFTSIALDLGLFSLFSCMSLCLYLYCSLAFFLSTSQLPLRIPCCSFPLCLSFIIALVIHCFLHFAPVALSATRFSYYLLVLTVLDIMFALYLRSLLHLFTIGLIVVSLASSFPASFFYRPFNLSVIVFPSLASDLLTTCLVCTFILFVTCCPSALFPNNARFHRVVSFLFILYH